MGLSELFCETVVWVINSTNASSKWMTVFSVFRTDLEATSGTEEPVASPFSWVSELWANWASLPVKGQRDLKLTQKCFSSPGLVPCTLLTKTMAHSSITSTFQGHFLLFSTLALYKATASLKQPQETQQGHPNSAIDQDRCYLLGLFWRSHYLFFCSFLQKSYFCPSRCPTL